MILFTYIQDLFRMAVRDQVENYRNSLFGGGEYVECSITRLRVPKSLCDIDHAPPLTFADLVYHFLRDYFPSGLIGIDPEDALLMREWKSYHFLHSKLRPVYRIANQQQEKDMPDWSYLLPNNVRKQFVGVGVHLLDAKIRQQFGYRGHGMLCDSHAEANRLYGDGIIAHPKIGLMHKDVTDYEYL